MKSERQKTYSLKQRFSYWFDNRMSKGSLGFIRILIVASILLALLMAGLIILFHFNEEGETASVFWDSISTVINAWMPSFEDGSLGYVIIMSITAIAGVLFTSVLIGIITSAIEEKIIDLKKGNSAILENGHIVVLGFNPGEYTLIEQLVLASEGKPTCIVVAEDMDRDEMEQLLEDNIDIPKNVRLVCRSVDISDPVSIEKCSIETCQSVIISPGDDSKIVKAILATVVLMQKKDIHDKQINAIVAKNIHRFPSTLAEAHNITTLQTDDILAKMVAHSCTQNGLADTFRNIFNFEGSEFRIVEIPEITGMAFGELMLRMDKAVPAGIFKGDRSILNPTADYLLEEGDRVLIFSEESEYRLSDDADFEEDNVEALKLRDSEYKTDALIIGHNETLPVVLRELPENVTRVTLLESNVAESEKSELQEIAEAREFTITYSNENPRRERGLTQLAKHAKHIMILSDHDKPEADADMDTIFLLLNLRDIRNSNDLDFNITVEMQREQSQHLVDFLGDTDFLVSNSMSSLVLAQTAKNPELLSVFKELLSNKGNELYLKNAATTGLSGKHSVRSLRHLLSQNGYILLGFVDKDKNSCFCLDPNETIELERGDNLIVLGEY